MLKNDENNIIGVALNKLIELTGLNIEITHNLRQDFHEIDLELKIYHEEKRWNFEAIVKKWVTAPMVGLLANQIYNNDKEIIVITKYIAPGVAKQLRKIGIQYMDTAGNMFLKQLPLYIEITGKKLGEPVENRVERRVFNPAGLQVIFGLLCDPDMINATYREIAKLTGAALGTVGWTFRDLKENGYLTEAQNRGRMLVNKEKLMRKWIEAYYERLRPKQVRGRFKARDNDWWRNTNITDYEAVWGGEVGAARMTNYLMPEIKTIYAKGNTINKLILRERMKRDQTGDIEIINKFWNFETPEIDIAPPLLVYADLIGTGDERNIETARLIYAERIEKYIR